MESAARLLREGNHISTRAPDRRPVLAAAEADAVCIGAVGVHDVDLLGAAAIGFERDLRAVWRVGGRGVNRGIVGETGDAARAQVHYVDVRIAALLKTHHDLVAVRREARTE